MKRPLVDSSFLIPALDPANTEADAPICRLAWAALLQLADCRIIVPAPVLAEISIGPSKGLLPRLQSTIVVPFDQECARLFAEFGRMAVPDGMVKGYVKFDSMIIACGLANKADYIITMDPNMETIARAAGLTPRHPKTVPGVLGVQLSLV